MKFTFVILLLLVVSSLSAQTVLTGRIISKAENEPISYASVTVKNNPNKGVTSNAEGWFSLQCNQRDTLHLQCIGYKTLTLIAADAFLKPLIELLADTIPINEVSVTAENAYSMLFRVRDNTIKNQMKSFQGYCTRKDELLLSGNAERISDSEIIFKSRKTKHGEIEIDYWLKKHSLELFSKSLNQPRISYTNTIPFILSEIKSLSSKGLLNAKFLMKSMSDNIILINVKTQNPNKQMTNDFYYFIDKNRWVFDAFEWKGDFRDMPIKKTGIYRFETNFKISYTTYQDSILLQNFKFNAVFSNSMDDTQNLWDYRVNMDIALTSVSPVIQGEKLRKLYYLLYKE